MEYKVQDFPDLIKRDGTVVNTNHDEYLRAKARRKQANRLNELESEVRGLHSKIDLLLELMTNGKPG